MADQVLGHPDAHPAIVDLSDGRRDVSHGDLRRMAGSLAARLAPQVQRGDRVGVLLGQDPWCAAAHIAIWKIGAISVPLFKLFRQEALRSRISDSGLTRVVTDAEGADLLHGLAKPVFCSDLDPTAFETVRTDPDDPAILIYTSGTTGTPKGALHSHRLLDGHLPGVSLSHDHLGQPGDCLWTPADWAWIGGLFDVLMPGLALGVPVVACRRKGFSAGEAARICAEGGVRNVFFPPTALRMLKAADQAIPALRSVASGGEPLGAEMLNWGRRAFGLTINEFYGQTECNMMISSCGAAFEPVPGAMGKAVPGFDVEVISETGAAAEGEGDIAVKRGAPSMMIGYWRNPEATALKFRGEWMLTGDRGSRDGAFIRFLGRDDDVITSSGYRIGPAEIEDCLLTHPDVLTCGVVGKPDPDRTEIVKAYVVPRSGVTPDEATLRDWVKSRLSGYAYPREISFVSELPMTVTGKVIRKELRARARAECDQ